MKHMSKHGDTSISEIKKKKKTKTKKKKKTQNPHPAVLVTNQYMNWSSHSARTFGWHSILNLPDAFLWTRDTASLMNKSLHFPLFLNTTQAV